METKEPKTALAIIVKDDSEALMLRRCLDSIRKYVDGLFITRTSSGQSALTKRATSIFLKSPQIISITFGVMPMMCGKTPSNSAK